jgi:hypothetical protein
MVENHQGKTVSGTGKKKAAGNRKKAQTGNASKRSAAPKETASQAPARKTTARKKAASRRPSGKTPPLAPVSPQERYLMIQEAAYFRAEKQGFNCDPQQCWVAAEAEIDALLASPR